MCEDKKPLQIDLTYDEKAVGPLVNCSFFDIYRSLQGMKQGSEKVPRMSYLVQMVVPWVTSHTNLYILKGQMP